MAKPPVRLREAVEEVLVQHHASQRRKAVAWMGFDYLIHVAVYADLWSEQVRVIERVFRHFMCWKALLVFGEQHGAGLLLRGTLILMGSQEVYSVVLDTRTGKVSWVKPQEFDILVMREFQNWEAEDEATTN
jgi:hypothetical protein